MIEYLEAVHERNSRPPSACSLILHHSPLFSVFSFDMADADVDMLAPEVVMPVKEASEPVLPRADKGKTKARQEGLDALDMSSLPWVEKYRPATLDDVVAHQDIISTSTLDAPLALYPSPCTDRSFSPPSQLTSLSSRTGFPTCSSTDLLERERRVRFSPWRARFMVQREGV